MPMEDSVLIEKLRAIVTTYSHDDAALASLSPDSDFLKDLKINSANLVDVVIDVEEAFGIVIDNDSMEKMLTVRSAMDIIKAKAAQP